MITVADPVLGVVRVAMEEGERRAMLQGLGLQGGEEDLVICCRCNPLSNPIFLCSPK